MGKVGVGEQWRWDDETLFIICRCGVSVAKLKNWCSSSVTLDDRTLKKVLSGSGNSDQYLTDLTDDIRSKAKTWLEASFPSVPVPSFRTVSISEAGIYNNDNALVKYPTIASQILAAQSATGPSAVVSVSSDSSSQTTVPEWLITLLSNSSAEAFTTKQWEAHFWDHLSESSEHILLTTLVQVAKSLPPVHAQPLIEAWFKVTNLDREMSPNEVALFINSLSDYLTFDWIVENSARHKHLDPFSDTSELLLELEPNHFTMLRLLHDSGVTDEKWTKIEFQMLKTLVNAKTMNLWPDPDHIARLFYDRCNAYAAQYARDGHRHEVRAFLDTVLEQFNNIVRDAKLRKLLSLRLQILKVECNSWRNWHENDSRYDQHTDSEYVTDITILNELKSIVMSESTPIYIQFKYWNVLNRRIIIESDRRNRFYASNQIEDKHLAIGVTAGEKALEIAVAAFDSETELNVQRAYFWLVQTIYLVLNAGKDGLLTNNSMLAQKLEPYIVHDQKKLSDLMDEGQKLSYNWNSWAETKLIKDSALSTSISDSFKAQAKYIVETCGQSAIEKLKQLNGSLTDPDDLVST